MLFYSFSYKLDEQFYYLYLNHELAKEFNKKPEDFYNTLISDHKNLAECETPSFTNYLSNLDQQESLINLVEMPYRKRNTRFFVFGIKISDSQQKEIIKALQIKPPPCPTNVSSVFFCVALPLNLKQVFNLNKKSSARLRHMLPLALLIFSAFLAFAQPYFKEQLKNNIQIQKNE